MESRGFVLEEQQASGDVAGYVQATIHVDRTAAIAFVLGVPHTA